MSETRKALILLAVVVVLGIAVFATRPLWPDGISGSDRCRAKDVVLATGDTHLESYSITVEEDGGTWETEFDIVLWNSGYWVVIYFLDLDGADFRELGSVTLEELAAVDTVEITIGVEPCGGASLGQLVFKEGDQVIWSPAAGD